MADFYSSNSYLSTSQMKVNAEYILNYLTARGWTKNAVCGMLGNMQRESTINPGIWQNLDSGNTSLGYGLVQWTPATKYFSWADSNGLERSHMDSQLKRILWELENGEQYYSTSSYPESFSEFTKSTKDVTYLASAFLHNYERAGVSAELERQQNAQYWYNNLSSGTPSEPSEPVIVFTPRLSKDGVNGSRYWYSDNPFYKSGFGLPNCTCYAYGRFWEISDLANGLKDYDRKPEGLSLRDARHWITESQGFETGSEPKLGAIACWRGETTAYAGHVAIVEEIKENGDIVVSQSAWTDTNRNESNSLYFYTSTRTKANGYNYANNSGALRIFQGFIYNPYVYQSGGGGDTPEPEPDPIPEPRKKKKKNYKFVIYER
jgi:surface antigen